MYDLCVECVDNNNASFDLDNFNEEIMYPNFTSPRGLALIINNRYFQTMPERLGTDVDESNFSRLLQQLGYSVTVYRNLCSKEMMSRLQIFSKNPHHATVHSCVVCVLTHGEHGEVYGVDDQPVSVQHMVSMLNAATRVLAVVFGCFFVCWTPFFAANFALGFCGNRCAAPPSVASLFLWLGYVSSTINPLIYTIFNRSNVERTAAIGILRNGEHCSTNTSSTRTNLRRDPKNPLHRCVNILVSPVDTADGNNNRRARVLFEDSSELDQNCALTHYQTSQHLPITFEASKTFSMEELSELAKNVDKTMSTSQSVSLLNCAAPNDNSNHISDHSSPSRQCHSAAVPFDESIFVDSMRETFL
ncbi:unnamed protein product [Anisakis simplex]|uniref:G-protein coupled receptors family 1 profile domain-containing protein n=1 Tax=Anisakis simplex TaxID=6269 RepID=A0A3P6T353_ANISI|nr:unnamed protein product [Anisakis simplex]